MKKLILCAALLALLPCCKKDKPADTKELAMVDNAKFKDCYGIWSGDLEPVFEEGDTLYVPKKKISIKIDRIVGNDVYGQSIVGGIQRPLKGRVSEKEGNMLMFTLDEPGTNKYDGRFELEMIRGSFMEGKYVSYKNNPDTTPVKTLKLTQKQFVYNPNFMLSEDIDLVDWEHPKEQQTVYYEYYDEAEGDTVGTTRVIEDSLEAGDKEVYLEEVFRTASEEVFKINASTRRLTEEELKNLRKLDLEIIRNTIFARHGYSFKKNSIRQFFEVNHWYVPVSNNVDATLTAVEKENIVLLKRLEKYAEDHYDSFGR
jgi:hypothetical protein